MMKSYLKKLNFTSLYYTIFEGLSKGGNQLLLILIASIINQVLYINIMLLISLEALVTMLFFSYYSDVLYSLKKNRSYQYTSNIYDVSILQFIFFGLIYYMFKANIDAYFNYNLNILFFIIIGNALFVNLIRYYSVCYQINLKHTSALIYKSIPFFLSFVFCLSFFFFFKDKILAFFLGKFVGLSIFFFYVFIKQKDYKKLFKSRLILFWILFKRVKYSFAIAMYGWAAGLGFLNFAKIYSGNEKYLLILGLMFNFFSILQLFANGINQVYLPKLKILLLDSLDIARRYSKKIFMVYFLLCIIFSICVSIVIFFRGSVIDRIPNVEPLLTNGVAYLVILLFLVNSFQWVTSPYLIVLDRYKQYLIVKILLNKSAWLLIIISIFVFKFNNFLIFFFLIQIFDCIGISLFIRNKIINVSNE